MVDNVSFGFIKKSRDPAPDNMSSTKPASKTSINALSKKEEQVHKGILELNRRLYKSISVFSKALESMEDTRETRNLKSVLGKAQKASSIQNKLRKGEVVNSEEARELIEAAESLNSVMQDNEKLRLKIKDLGYKSEDLDITKPLVTASQKIAESAKDLFITNAERITQSDAAADIAKTGVRAVSPELAFLTESLGVGLPDFFGSEEEQDNAVVTEIVKLEEAVENLEDAVSTGQDKTAENQTENTKKHIKADKKLLEQKVQAEKANQETQLAVQADQHRESMEILDDIRDSQNRTLFEKFMDFFDIRKSPFLKKAGVIGAAAGAASVIGGSLESKKGKGIVSAGKTGLKGLGVGLGSLLGLDALRNIKEEGLTSGNILQSAGTGALIGSVFGPLGALIGGGVGTLAAFITDAISPQDMRTIESGFKSASDFISNGIGKGINKIVESSKRFYTAVKEGKLTEWFEKIGDGIKTSTKELRDKVNTKLGGVISEYDDVFEDIGSRISGFITNIKTTSDKIMENYKKNDPEGYKADAAVFNALAQGVKDIMSFLSSPSEFLTNEVFGQNQMNDIVDDFIDFMLNPLYRMQEVFRDSINFLGGDTTELDSFISNRQKAIEERKERMAKNKTTALQQTEINTNQTQLLEAQAKQEQNNKDQENLNTLNKNREELLKQFDKQNTLSTPVNDTSNISTPTSIDTDIGLEVGTAIQSQNSQVVQEAVKSQAQQTEKIIKMNTPKKEDKKEQSKLGKGQRSQSNSPLASNDIGMLITLTSLV